jgi:hemerythrin-like domain-containing protein
MLRDKNLIPLSHQHQHALALCVRIDRANPIPEQDLPAWQIEIEQHFEHEIRFHFAAEEAEVFPVARKFPQLILLIEDLHSEHTLLRELFHQAQARRMSGDNLVSFAAKLSAHIRKEERQLFEHLQKLMSQEELNDLGKRVELALAEASQSCILPMQATKLQSKK